MISLNFNKTNKLNATAANYSHLITFIIQLWFINRPTKRMIYTKTMMLMGEKQTIAEQRYRERESERKEWEKHLNYYDTK